jgi:hypothetical protein
MRCTVLWVPSAEQELALAWMKSTDRQAVTNAAFAIDQFLAQDPETRGEARFDTVRTLSVPPLGVDFEVMEEDRLVYVLTCWDTTTLEKQA